MSQLVNVRMNTLYVPEITVVNQAKTSLGVELEQLVRVLQAYVDEFVGPVWGVACRLTIGKAIKNGTWGMQFVDRSPVPDAIAYHEVARSGAPLMTIGLLSVLAADESICGAASHELSETLVDAGCQMAAQNGSSFVAYEVADPVQGHSFELDGLHVSNFVYPAWFESFRKKGSAQFDQMGVVDKPFTLARGGYVSEFRGGQWNTRFGSKAARRQFDKRPHFRSSRRVALRF
jgi:hypothetical protein